MRWPPYIITAVRKQRMEGSEAGLENLSAYPQGLISSRKTLPPKDVRITQIVPPWWPVSKLINLWWTLYSPTTKKGNKRHHLSTRGSEKRGLRKGELHMLVFFLSRCVCQPLWNPALTADSVFFSLTMQTGNSSDPPCPLPASFQHQTGRILLILLLREHHPTYSQETQIKVCRDYRWWKGMRLLVVTGNLDLSGPHWVCGKSVGRITLPERSAEPPFSFSSSGNHYSDQ